MRALQAVLATLALVVAIVSCEQASSDDVSAPAGRLTLGHDTATRLTADPAGCVELRSPEGHACRVCASGPGGEFGVECNADLQCSNPFIVDGRPCTACLDTANDAHFLCEAGSPEAPSTQESEECWDELGEDGSLCVVCREPSGALRRDCDRIPPPMSCEVYVRDDGARCKRCEAPDGELIEECDEPRDEPDSTCALVRSSGHDCSICVLDDGTARTDCALPEGECVSVDFADGLLCSVCGSEDARFEPCVFCVSEEGLAYGNCQSI